MLIKGKARGGPVNLARHLEAENNERVTIIGIHGVAALDIEGALLEMDAMGSCAESKRTLYHMSINPDRNETMQPEHWATASAMLREKLDLAAQPYIEIEHEKYGKDGVLRTHRHLVALRIDVENERAISDSFNYRKHEEVSRELERILGHERVQGAHAERERAEGEICARPDRTPSHAEMQQAARTGLSPKEAKEFVTGLWQTTDCGTAFAAALEAEGWMLARGDKRDFVLVDVDGETHSLARRVDGAKAADVRARMADLDPASLPTVDEAKQMQADRQREAAHWDRDAANTAWENAVTQAALAKERHPYQEAAQEAAQRPEQLAAAQTQAEAARASHGPEARPLGQTASDIRTAWQTSRTATELEDGLAARGIGLAIVSAEEAYISERQAALARAAHHFAPAFREGETVAVNGRGDVYRLDERTTGQTEADIAGRLVGVDRAALMSVTETQDAMCAASLAAWKDERRAEREAARPANWIEQRIADCGMQAKHGGAIIQQDAEGRTVTAADALADRLAPERMTAAATVHGAAAFAAQLEDAGIAIARVTAEDERALAALRHGEDMNRTAAETNGQSYQGNRFAEILPGELAAVTRSGDVFGINPAKLGEAAQYISAELPGVVEVRAQFEIERERKADVWQQRRDEIADAGVAYAERQELRQTVRAAETAVETAIEAPAAAVEAVGAGLRFLGGLSRILEGAIEFLGGLFGGGAPRMTTAQAELAGRAADERAEQRADAAHVQHVEYERDWQAHSFKTAQQEKDLRLSQTLGTPATAEANLGRDPYERQRERERDW